MYIKVYMIWFKIDSHLLINKMKSCLMNKNFFNIFNLISHILILNDSDFLYIYNIDIKVTKSCKVSFSVVGPIFVSIRPISTRYHDTVNLVPVQPTLDSWHITLYVGTLYRFFKSIFIITSLF